MTYKLYGTIDWTIVAKWYHKAPLVQLMAYRSVTILYCFNPRNEELIIISMLQFKISVKSLFMKILTR